MKVVLTGDEPSGDKFRTLEVTDASEKTKGVVKLSIVAQEKVQASISISRDELQQALKAFFFN